MSTQTAVEFLLMSIKLDEQKKRDPIICTLTLPVGNQMLAEYKELSKLLDAEGLRSMHSFTRERIQTLISELRKELAEHIKNKAG